MEFLLVFQEILRSKRVGDIPLACSTFPLNPLLSIYLFNRGLPGKSYENEVMSEVQLGELLCDSMTEAENATLLSFHISADEVGNQARTWGCSFPFLLSFQLSLKDPTLVRV